MKKLLFTFTTLSLVGTLACTDPKELADNTTAALDFEQQKYEEVLRYNQDDILRHSEAAVKKLHEWADAMTSLSRSVDRAYNKIFEADPEERLNENVQTPIQSLAPELQRFLLRDIDLTLTPPRWTALEEHQLNWEEYRGYDFGYNSNFDLNALNVRRVELLNALEAKSAIETAFRNIGRRYQQFQTLENIKDSFKDVPEKMPYIELRPEDNELYDTFVDCVSEMARFANVQRLSDDTPDQMNDNPVDFNCYRGALGYCGHQVDLEKLSHWIDMKIASVGQNPDQEGCSQYHFDSMSSTEVRVPAKWMSGIRDTYSKEPLFP